MVDFDQSGFTDIKIIDSEIIVENAEVNKLKETQDWLYV